MDYGAAGRRGVQSGVDSKFVVELPLLSLVVLPPESRLSEVSFCTDKAERASSLQAAQLLFRIHGP
jgi:hypothetical protein